MWRLKALQRKEAYQSIALGLKVSKFQQPNSYAGHGFRDRENQKITKKEIWRLKALQRKATYQSIALGLKVSKFQQPHSCAEHGFSNKKIKKLLKWGIGEAGNRGIWKLRKV